MGIIRRLIKLVGAVYLLTLLAVVAFSTLYTNPESPGPADMIVCLGAGVDGKGVIDGPARARAETCAALFASGVAEKVIFTGGNGVPGAPSGAQGMAEAAMAVGLLESAVLLEHASRSTLQNALFSAPQMADVDRILIVSDAFHLPRSAASFAGMGDWDIAIWASDGVWPSPLGGKDWHMLYREALAIWFNLARYAAWRGGKALGLSDIDHWLT